MRLWQRLAEALKDKNSMWATRLSRHTSVRNPDLEVAATKATSYDVHTPPLYLKNLIWALAMRMQKTLPPPNTFPPSSPASVSLFPLQTRSLRRRRHRSLSSPSRHLPFSPLNRTPFTFSNIAWHHRRFFRDPLSSCWPPDESRGGREEKKISA
ncbi:hypothetical protein QN277_011891 [Acacia crassicarpa]|uniref:Uncharacterized protein n=1 Tax=Acacia crassicarpa TaxID=499986 RepID=A0AAE1MZB9_9FABA|nr:hypothetical protein QN277_011891 [Acacia crassicarpa]